MISDKLHIKLKSLHTLSEDSNITNFTPQTPWLPCLFFLEFHVGFEPIDASFRPSVPSPQTKLVSRIFTQHPFFVSETFYILERSMHFMGLNGECLRVEVHWRLFKELDDLISQPSTFLGTQTSKRI